MQTAQAGPAVPHTPPTHTCRSPSHLSHWSLWTSRTHATLFGLNWWLRNCFGCRSKCTTSPGFRQAPEGLTQIYFNPVKFTSYLDTTDSAGLLQTEMDTFTGRQAGSQQSPDQPSSDPFVCLVVDSRVSNKQPIERFKSFKYLRKMIAHKFTFETSSVSSAPPPQENSQSPGSSVSPKCFLQMLH